EDNIILTREIVRGGRSVARINGQAVTVALLKEVGHQLINIHGQHEHMLLLEDSRQLSFIDSYAGDVRKSVRTILR
ncbi:MAG: DNA repair protein RecN, partial [Muribaculaceae bacterium]|nr:DNA repair protein RecN [Muribaculaceae bacterium]